MQFKRFLQFLLFLILGTSTLVWSSSYKVLYNFTANSGVPTSGLTFDSAGNAYGTAWPVDSLSGGTVYELSSATGYHVTFVPK